MKVVNVITASSGNLPRVARNASALHSGTVSKDPPTSICTSANSPKLEANTRMPPETTPPVMFGTTTRRTICSGVAPQVSAASLSATTSAAAIAPSTAQYRKGKWTAA